MALNDKVPDAHFKADESLMRELQSRLRDGKIPCAAAFAAAEARSVTPRLLGKTMDAEGIRLTHCQLGLFGYPGHSKLWDAPGYTEAQLPHEVEKAILDASAGTGRISCRAAWEIADRLGIARSAVGRTADRLGIRLSECQLGAF